MKPTRKVVNMDYRHQSARTFGMFAEPHWPRDDETLVSMDFHRNDRRIRYTDNNDQRDREVIFNQHRNSIVYDGRRMG